MHNMSKRVASSSIDDYSPVTKKSNRTRSNKYPRYRHVLWNDPRDKREAQ